MPDIEVDELNDFAVIFPLAGVDIHGEPTYGTPLQIPCRWLGKTTVSSDPKKRTKAFTATLISDQEIETDTLIWKGKLADFPLPAGGGTVAGLHQIDSSNYTDDIRGGATRYEFTLKRYRNVMPVVGLHTWGGTAVAWGSAAFTWGG